MTVETVVAEEKRKQKLNRKLFAFRRIFATKDCFARRHRKIESLKAKNRGGYSPKVD